MNIESSSGDTNKRSAASSDRLTLLPKVSCPSRPVATVRVAPRTNRTRAHVSERIQQETQKLMASFHATSPDFWHTYLLDELNVKGVGQHGLLHWPTWSKWVVGMAYQRSCSVKTRRDRQENAESERGWG